ncbi:formyltetrahydrofolate deformylase [Candidatus Woesearchaeota archaeon]|nr:formyltetrahydrofolate deformylase [Candidatus Woesearchaeota archaeon]
MNNKNVTATLLLSCPDRKGLVAGVSAFLYHNNGNIIHADQHTDAEKGIFLQRVEWELKDFKIPRERIGEAFSPLAKKFNMKWHLRFSDYAPRIAILVSKEEHCLYELLLRQRMKEFNAEIPLVISNHPDLQPVAENFGVEFHYYPITPKTKSAYEKRILKNLEEHDIDLIVLAKYMQVLSANLISKYSNRIINIHHSFLPAFAGGKPYHQAHQRGVKIIGATAHYVTAELDQGPIIEQDVMRVSHRDSVEDLTRKGKDMEKIVLARAVDLHLRNKILVYDNKTVVFD